MPVTRKASRLNKKKAEGKTALQLALPSAFGLFSRKLLLLSFDFLKIRVHHIIISRFL